MKTNTVSSSLNEQITFARFFFLLSTIESNGYNPPPLRGQFVIADSFTCSWPFFFFFTYSPLFVSRWNRAITQLRNLQRFARQINEEQVAFATRRKLRKIHCSVIIAAKEFITGVTSLFATRYCSLLLLLWNSFLGSWLNFIFIIIELEFSSNRKDK